MADDKTISNNVVKGPWKRAKTIEPAQTDKMYNDIAWSEEVTESVMIPLIHNLAENGVDVKSDMFVSEVGFMNEIVKSILLEKGIESVILNGQSSTHLSLNVDNDVQVYVKNINVIRVKYIITKYDL